MLGWQFNILPAWFWTFSCLQESAIVLSKLLLPQIFEKMATQELRALVAERSEMTIYLRGETFEIRPHCIGFLLEGFINAQGGQEELITSPAALQPSHGNFSFQSAEASGNKILWSITSYFTHKATHYLHILACEPRFDPAILLTFLNLTGCPSY